MESEGHELDEVKLDSAIADLMEAEAPPRPQREPAISSILPELPSQESLNEASSGNDAGLAATLRQKWAELCGAA
ncbi:hypothetical protein [Ruegeria sp. Ofav3-42]|uniref:hypothetical protein n=1 Tax=Ruegeria sp. Ofav3-42 TaxID=2917759 RepID=UPI001EF6FEE8|nr:hypothetical protein [Ruegeria sp. Ofav3-42]MCG7520111.1 hypothetical protein [Ruegeria sp. Ofav3-42]